MMKSSRRKFVSTEKFYTKSSVAKHLVDEVRKKIDFSCVSRVIEPSAGSGSFSKLFDDCLAFDIEPSGVGIQKADFLNLPLSFQPGTLVIGNPPFGRQASLAIRFLKKSCELADWVAFILPISFQKESMRDRVPLTHSLLFEYVLEPSSFIKCDDENDECFIRTVFQIWERKPRQKRQKKELSIQFVKTPQEADFAIRRVGVKAGNIVDDPYSVAVASHYFVKGDEILKQRLRKIDWTIISSLTIGPRSISKSEISKMLEA